MKTKLKRALCLALALVMMLAFAACKKDEEVPAETSPTQKEEPKDTQTASPPPTQEVEEKPAETPTPPAPVPEAKTLVVGYSMFSQKFSPFFGKTAYDMDVANMTQVQLLINDRVGNIIYNGIKGETYNYNGTDYFYSNIADFDVVQKPDGTVDYNITIRDDILFSDGVKMTVDDVIFNLYVYSDPKYDGSSTFYSLPISGMQSFRTGVSADIYDKYEEIGYAILAAGPDNTNYANWTEDQQDAFWTTCFYEGGIAFTQEIIDTCVASYSRYMSMVWNSEVALGMFAWGFGWPGDADDDEDEDIFYTNSGEEFNIAGGHEPTVDDYWNELLAEYGEDIDELNYESAGSALEDLIVLAFISNEGPKDPDAGGEIMNVSGIKRTGDYSLTITTDYFEATTIYGLALQVAPLHYYGDKNQYDYANNKFGFPKGDLSLVKAKTTTPVGAGPYKFLSYESGVVSFEANESYYKGAPKTKFMRFQEVTDGDKLAGVVSGSFDITDPSFSVTAVESIKEYNSNGELSGNTIVTSTVDNLGYGYIGICANNVNVGGNPNSEASRNLRSAIATLLAVFRSTVNHSYYGDRASTIQYPISNTSWAAPRPNDAGYREAYSIDVNGAPIYTDAMSAVQKEAAALEAAIDFLKAAGYTFDEASGMFTAAPAGASLIYEAIIPADGVGDHPAYGVLTATKEALASIGLTLEINDPVDSNVLWTALESGQAELWCAAWQATIDPDMYQVYHSSNIVGQGGTDSNHYAIADEELDNLILEARLSADQSFRKATYKRCLEIIMEWAVEIPNYQRQNAIIFSPQRVKMDTVTPDITTFWGWANDLELIEVN